MLLNIYIHTLDEGNDVDDIKKKEILHFQETTQNFLEQLHHQIYNFRIRPALKSLI